MQKTSKDISNIISKEHPEYSYELVESLNQFIFAKLKEKIKKGDSLLYFLPPIGNFVFRLKETKKVLAHELNKRVEYQSDEMKSVINRIIDNYVNYTKDKLEKKYERFGKENHENYILAKKQEKIQKWKENKSK